ncbi:hypothetical protein Avbf_13187 [Armadillidium vulgare]|nr:hypothetical protein Avbf_13187 [Armadillidium vulgare]
MSNLENGFTIQIVTDITPNVEKRTLCFLHHLLHYDRSFECAKWLAGQNSFKENGFTIQIVTDITPKVEKRTLCFLHHLITL